MMEAVLVLILIAMVYLIITLRDVARRVTVCEKDRATIWATVRTIENRLRSHHV